MSDPFESQSDSATAVAEPVVTTRSEPRSKTDLADQSRQAPPLPPYHVVILNDEEHTYDYVIELLCKLFGHPVSTALELTTRIDKTGLAVVYTTHKEKAELKRDQVLAYGPDPRMSISRGPLRCYIEPAPAG